MDKKTQDKLDKAIRALLDMDAVPHERPKYTKADLKRKFVLRLKRNGQPEIKEV